MTHKRGIRKPVIVAVGALVISGILSGPASAQNDPFHGIFEEGYDFLNRTVHNSVEFPDRRAVLDEMPSRALFGDGYAVTRSPPGTSVPLPRGRRLKQRLEKDIRGSFRGDKRPSVHERCIRGNKAGMAPV
jgi:hypothetical protein